MNKAIKELLSSNEYHPVLLDVGASGSGSGAQSTIWDKLAPHAYYVGFDADKRDIQENQNSHFWRSTIVNRAVVADKKVDQAMFYLTTSPHCSSTLEPDHKALQNYLFSNLFTIENQISVPATSFSAVIDQLSLESIDWFKTDSQGTDLTLFHSLEDDIRDRVLAVDIEPGLIDAYMNEDLFIDAHRALMQEGYWLSDITVKGSIRMNRDSLGIVSHRDSWMREQFVRRSVKTSPGWCEARYLRTLGWLEQSIFTQREYVLLWIFAILDRQFGFAIDLAIQYEECFGQDSRSQIMKKEPVRLMRRRLFPALLIEAQNRLMQWFSSI